MDCGPDVHRDPSGWRCEAVWHDQADPTTLPPERGDWTPAHLPAAGVRSSAQFRHGSDRGNTSAPAMRAAFPAEQPFSRPWRDSTLRLLLTHHW